MKQTVETGFFFKLADEIEEIKGTIWWFWMHDKVTKFKNLNGEKLNRLMQKRWKIGEEFFEVEDTIKDGKAAKQIVMVTEAVPAKDENGIAMIGGGGETREVPKVLEGKTIEGYEEALKSFYKELIEINL